ncbi:MAG TPA: hypothetical protein VGR43_10755 [Dehalococcoidia bacterium]|jgi:hypothetical protein|nr:hypothetical protein [Dehalococcoidia bacterium]
MFGDELIPIRRPPQPMREVMWLRLNMKWANVIIGITTLVVVLFPPWQVKWTDPTTGDPPFIVREQYEFSGIHFWGYIPNPSTKIIAWDGENTGGIIEVKAVPSIVTNIFSAELGLLCLVWLGLFLWRRNNVAA